MCEVGGGCEGEGCVREGDEEECTRSVRGRDIPPWSIFQGRGGRLSVQTELGPHDLDT